MFSLWEVQWENSHVGRLRVQFHLHASISLGKAQLIMVPSHMDLLLLPNLKKKNKKIADFFLLQKLHYQTSQIYRDVSIGAAESE